MVLLLYIFGVGIEGSFWTPVPSTVQGFVVVQGDRAPPGHRTGAVALLVTDSSGNQALPLQKLNTDLPC